MNYPRLEAYSIVLALSKRLALSRQPTPAAIVVRDYNEDNKLTYGIDEIIYDLVGGKMITGKTITEKELPRKLLESTVRAEPFEKK